MHENCQDEKEEPQLSYKSIRLKALISMFYIRVIILDCKLLFIYIFIGAI